MAKVKTNFPLAKKGIKLTSAQKKLLGRSIDKAVKSRIARGISPVQFAKKFASYAVDRSEAVGDYPVGIKSKKPVNLKLTGKMLRSMTFKIMKKGIKYGMIGASPKLDEIFLVHNEGLRKDIPKRHMLPTKKGEKFQSGVQKQIKTIYLKIIKAIIKKTNR